MLNYNFQEDSDILSSSMPENIDFLAWMNEVDTQRGKNSWQEDFEVQVFELQLEEQIQQDIVEEEKYQLGELKALLIKDKEAGWQYLMERYHLLFHQLAYNSVHNYDLARDAVSIASEAIYRWLVDADPYDITSVDLLPYLCRIVRNKSCDVYKKERGQRLREKRLKQKIYLESESLEEAIERDENIQAVREAVAQLPLKFSTVIRLRYGLDEEGSSFMPETGNERYKHIASITGCNESTARTYESRARKKMKRILEKRLDPPS